MPPISQEFGNYSRNHKATDRARGIGEAIQSLFDASVLDDEAAIYTSASKLDRLFDNVNYEIEDVLQDLEFTQYLIEFVLCVAGHHAFAILSTEMMRPPSHDPVGLRRWMVPKLLVSFFDRLPVGAPQTLVAHGPTIQSTSLVLAALVELLERGQLADNPDEISLGHRTTKARLEKNHKGRAAHSSRVSSEGEQKIIDYGADVPTTRQEAEFLVDRVVKEQTAILQAFLDAFRTDDVASVYKTAYLPHLSPTTNEATGRNAPHETQTASGTLGPWRILMLPRAERDLRKVSREDKKRLKIVTRKIKDLAMGYFSRDNYKILAGGDNDIPVYEAKMTRDSRLIYYIDCLSDFDTQRQEQVIKICGIYTHAQIDQRFWDSVSRNLRSKSLDPEYRQRCIFRKEDPTGQAVYLPGSFESSDVSVVQETNVQNVPLSPVVEITQEYQDQLQEFLMMDQFMTFSREYLTCIIEDQDMASVFDISWLSDREMTIMYHPHSCFVLGRGGTGKTTTMVYKILAQERSWADRFQTTMRKPRQLFVTQSQVLVQKVEEYYARRSKSFTPAHLQRHVKAITTADETNERKPLLVDADEEVYWNAALPKRYGALRDEDFPMFLTFDHLCRLLEGEFQYMVEQEKTGRAQAVVLRDVLRLRATSSTRRKDYVEDPRAAFVDYDTFLEKYWAHLPYGLRDPRLSPELVFGEIMGVTKGSEQALNSEQGYLDQETYSGIRRRSHATSDEQRELIYRIFEAYTKRKKEYGQYDAADRTRMLLKCLDSVRLPRDILPKFIYVDEAQDNLLIDALVLRKLCSNPHGMFWAGDTAQTISAGSAFRFDELKALMYRVDQSGGDSILGTHAQAETFHLTTNFRSHAGIVDCAHSVVQLLMKYWPDSVDRLPQERGQITGHKPIFFSDRNGAELQRALFRDSTNGARVEFGTEQCILVRNDAARRRLRQEMGDIGQILTVYESKGLEFNDVLLYYPFGDSTVDEADWDVLLNEVSGRTGPVFNVGKHAGVCRELKHLYVAITRARTNLWILDCSQAASPLLLLWADRGLIDIHPQGEPVPKLAVSSGKEEWAKAARNLFRKRQYSEAMHGFERAGLHHERQVSLAYLLRDQARATPANPRVGISQAVAFSEAAKAFIEAAAEAEDGSEQRTYYRIAGECYTRTGDDRKAGCAFRSAQEYALAAQHFRRAGSFDEAVQVVKEHEDDIPAEISQRIIEVSKLQYIRENKIEKARALHLFEDEDEALEYMDDYGLDSSRASYLEKLGRFAEAAECCLTEGNRLEALRLLSYDRQSQQSTVKAVEHILEGLWEHLSLCTPEENWHDPAIEQLLGHAEILNDHWVTPTARNELSMFRAVFGDDIAALSSLGTIYVQQDYVAASVLCLDQVFSHAFDLTTADLEEITDCFRSFLNLARSLQRLTCVPDACDSRDIQKLLAFKPSNGEMLSVSRSCHLFTMCNNQSTPSMQQTSGGVLVPRWELEPLIRKTLRERLAGHVRYQTEAAHQLGPKLQPCILFALHYHCPKKDCRQIHIPKAEATSRYNALVRIRLIQVMIYHTLYACEIPFQELHHQQRVWLRRLYEALYPSHVNLGSLHVLSFDLVPELRQARSILAVWVRDFLNRINPREDPPKAFMVNLMRATRLAMQFDRRATIDDLPRIPCAVRYEPPPQLIRTVPHGEQYVVHDLIGMMRFEDPSALDKGVRFVNHLLQRRVYVDIGVLCDFMDHLCAAMLIAARSQTLAHKSTSKCLHGLVLPTTWWIHIAGDADRIVLVRTREVHKYIGCAHRLLQAIYTGVNASHLLFEGRDMSYSGINQTRLAYMERVCKNLFLWGHNLASSQTREDIMGVLASLRTRQTNGPLQNLKAATCYTDVKDWKVFRRMMLDCLHDSLHPPSLDPLVRLHHRSVSTVDPSMDWSTVTLNAKTVVFSDAHDILEKLQVQHIPMLSSNFSPDDVHSCSDGSLNPQPGQTGPGSFKLSDVEDGDGSGTSNVEFTPEEEAAAVRIAAVYRKYMGRKTAEKDALTEMRRRVLTDFQARSELMDWLDPAYRVLFRRAVPRLILVAECLKDHLHAAKEVAKTRVHGAPHRELEDIQAALNEVSKQFKEACALHKTLAPTASVHKTCDFGKLAEYAGSVVRLHSWLHDQSPILSDLKVDIDIAMALISRSRRGS